ncbi:SEC-C domain-containing protein [Rhodopseudomonas sp. HC1]|uniref:YchJ family protein n=1 Tax=Rhodopseudomonas infernalis TaxID=2897386 RepID=UPI001EE89BE7|nr:YchJ family metal-binding protein [Rhodopseudomonas infernalis]MCG6204059.1 SEC-C domain-containing protein [Rhodopseudomonas infernalis]
MTCVCGSGKSYDDCCGPLLARARQAQSPEALMRSRYAAYVLKDFDYIVETTDPDTTALFDHDANRAWMEQSTFVDLLVLASSEKGSRGNVEFVARFSRNGTDQTHHEHSQFRKHKGRWYFSGGETAG